MAGEDENEGGSAGGGPKINQSTRRLGNYTSNTARAAFTRRKLNGEEADDVGDESLEESKKLNDGVNRLRTDRKYSFKSIQDRLDKFFRGKQSGGKSDTETTNELLRDLPNKLGRHFENLANQIGQQIQMAMGGGHGGDGGGGHGGGDFSTFEAAQERRYGRIMSALGQRDHDIQANIVTSAKQSRLNAAHGFETQILRFTDRLFDGSLALEYFTHRLKEGADAASRNIGSIEDQFKSILHGNDLNFGPILEDIKRNLSTSGNAFLLSGESVQKFGQQMDEARHGVIKTSDYALINSDQQSDLLAKVYEELVGQGISGRIDSTAVQNLAGKQFDQLKIVARMTGRTVDELMKMNSQHQVDLQQSIAQGYISNDRAAVATSLDQMLAQFKDPMSEAIRDAISKGIMYNGNVAVGVSDDLRATLVKSNTLGAVQNVVDQLMNGKSEDVVGMLRQLGRAGARGTFGQNQKVLEGTPAATALPFFNKLANLNPQDQVQENREHDTTIESYIGKMDEYLKRHSQMFNALLAGLSAIFGTATLAVMGAHTAAMIQHSLALMGSTGLFKKLGGLLGGKGGNGGILSRLGKRIGFGTAAEGAESAGGVASGIGRAGSGISKIIGVAGKALKFLGLIGVGIQVVNELLGGDTEQMERMQKEGISKKAQTSIKVGKALALAAEGLVMILGGPAGFVIGIVTMIADYFTDGKVSDYLGTALAALWDGEARGRFFKMSREIWDSIVDFFQRSIDSVKSFFGMMTADGVKKGVSPATTPIPNIPQPPQSPVQPRVIRSGPDAGLVIPGTPPVQQENTPTKTVLPANQTPAQAIPIVPPANQMQVPIPTVPGPMNLTPPSTPIIQSDVSRNGQGLPSIPDMNIISPITPTDSGSEWLRRSLPPIRLPELPELPAGAPVDTPLPQFDYPDGPQIRNVPDIAPPRARINDSIDHEDDGASTDVIRMVQTGPNQSATETGSTIETKLGEMVSLLRRGVMVQEDSSASLKKIARGTGYTDPNTLG